MSPGCFCRGLAFPRKMSSAAIPAKRFYMNDSSIGTDGSAPVAKRNHLATISEHKLKANRENSKKSTGPRTLRGKAYSRRNALKHGLFAREFMDFISQLEDPEEWEELLNGLWVQYRPIGKAEELEVERAALCWWRLKRVWRYENVTNRVALRDIGRRELREQAEYCKTLEKEEEAVILQLQDAMKQFEAAGEISQELKQRMFATMPGFEAIWPAIEKGGEEILKTAVLSKIVQESSVRERTRSRKSRLPNMSFRIARFSTKFFAMRQRSSETSHAPLIDSNACRNIVGENLFPAEARPQSVILLWRSRICKTKPTSHLLSATRWERF